MRTIRWSCERTKSQSSDFKMKPTNISTDKTKRIQEVVQRLFVLEIQYDQLWDTWSCTLIKIIAEITTDYAARKIFGMFPFYLPYRGNIFFNVCNNFFFIQTWWCIILKKSVIYIACEALIHLSKVIHHYHRNCELTNVTKTSRFVTWKAQIAVMSHLFLQMTSSA